MLNTIFNKISKCCCIISILALCACIVVNAYEIFCRNFLAKSLYWIQDWTSFCMVWFVSFGMITITWEKKDIYIELILEKLPEKLQRVIRICICVLTIAFCSFVATRILAYMKLNVGKYMTTARRRHRHVRLQDHVRRQARLRPLLLPGAQHLRLAGIL